jgi:hypothetical protein
MLEFLHLPKNKLNYSHMERINTIIIFKWMDCKGGNGIKCKIAIVLGITTRSKCMRDGMTVLMEMQRLMKKVMMCCPPMIREATRIFPSPSSSSRSLPGWCFVPGGVCVCLFSDPSSRVQYIWRGGASGGLYGQMVWAGFAHTDAR